MKRNHSATGCLVAIVIAVVTAVAMFATCPKPYEHRRVIREVVDEAVEERLGNSSSVAEALMKWIGRQAISMGSGIAVEEMVSVDSYCLFSVGRIEWKGEERIVSVGVLGHVFTASKEDVVRMMKENGL